METVKLTHLSNLVPGSRPVDTMNLLLTHTSGCHWRTQISLAKYEPVNWCSVPISSLTNDHCLALLRRQKGAPMQNVSHLPGQRHAAILNLVLRSEEAKVLLEHLQDQLEDMDPLNEAREMVVFHSLITRLHMLVD